MGLNRYEVTFRHPMTRLEHSRIVVEAMNPFLAEREARLKFNELHPKETATGYFYNCVVEGIEE